MGKALADDVAEGLTPSEAAKQAHKVCAKATNIAAPQANRILGPIISCGWDFFEAMYSGGSMMGGFLRGTGALFGTYVGGFLGEEQFGKLGYLAGSHVES
jgi:predicted lipid-binding transport protein (Tim44 family)